MKGEFLIYAPSSEGASPLELNSTKMPFENQPFKKCQIETFAKKDYQAFDFNGTEAIKHKLNEIQLTEVIAQCNAKSAMPYCYENKVVTTENYITQCWGYASKN